MKAYEFDSEEKQKVREKWIEYITSIKSLEAEDSSLSVMTLPSHEFQEIRLYIEKGFLKAKTIEESGVLRITEGKVVCFEKSVTKFRLLQKNLANAMTSNTDIGHFFRKVRSRFDNGSRVREFPVDVINMDFDGSLAKLEVPIFEILENMFYYQSLSKKNFVFFITFPESENTDPIDYKEHLIQIIKSNLEDPINFNFKNSFNEKFGNLLDLDYENIHVIGFLKWLIRYSSEKRYKIVSFDSIKYGNKKLTKGSRKRMHSLLFQFEYSEENINRNLIYYEDIQNAFEDSLELTK